MTATEDIRLMDKTGWNSPLPFEQRLLAHMRADRQQVEDIQCGFGRTRAAIERSIRAVAESRKVLDPRIHDTNADPLIPLGAENHDAA